MPKDRVGDAVDFSYAQSSLLCCACVDIVKTQCRDGLFPYIDRLLCYQEPDAISTWYIRFDHDMLSNFGSLSLQRAVIYVASSVRLFIIEGLCSLVAGPHPPTGRGKSGVVHRFASPCNDK